ncbi:O-antigen ligase family protein [Brunnivagina elsteri]|uniref:O-antigen ligase family protein n=1 Tax=Brunnivagina elsteri TaxID=1247191 RepID=UPI001FE775E8|nr:O-antigen ligase family protein [Calothrix elsteri]
MHLVIIIPLLANNIIILLSEHKINRLIDERRIIVGIFVRLLEKLFVILALTFFCGAFGQFALGDVIPKFIITLIRFSVWGISTTLICIFWKDTIFILLRNKILFLLTFLSFISFIWSVAPEFTLSNIRDVMMMTCFGLYFASRFTLKEQIQLIALTLLIGAFLSTIFSLGLPAIGKHGAPHPGAWKGIYGDKNNFGSMMVLSSLAFFMLPKDNLKLYKWGGFIVSLILILLSTSKTSLIIFFLLILFIFFYKEFRWQGKISVIFVDLGVLLLGCISLLIFSYWAEFLTSLQRDPTLTGRVPVWGFVISKLMERPLLGYGREGFWAPNSSFAISAGQTVTSGGWVTPHAHNGFLDIALDVGLIGLLLFLITFVITFARSLKQAYAAEYPEELWSLAFLCFLVMNNLTESFLLRGANLYWVLYISTAFTLSQKRFVKSKIRHIKYLHEREVSINI